MNCLPEHKNAPSCFQGMHSGPTRAWLRSKSLRLQSPTNRLSVWRMYHCHTLTSYNLFIVTCSAYSVCLSELHELWPKFFCTTVIGVEVLHWRCWQNNHIKTHTCIFHVLNIHVWTCQMKSIIYFKIPLHYMANVIIWYLVFKQCWKETIIISGIKCRLNYWTNNVDDFHAISCIENID